MPILDAPTLATAMNRIGLLDYPPGYLTSVIASVQQAIADYLLFDPVLSVVQNEEGAVELDSSGLYRSLYRLQLRHAPLVPGPASSIFSALTVTYARITQPAIAVNLAYVVPHHTAGQVFISPGGLSQLAGVSFDLGGPFGYLQADGYTANYVAGYATGIGDPVPSGGGTGFTAHAVVTNGVVTAIVVDTPGTGYRSVPFMTVVSGLGYGAQLQPVLVGGTIPSVTVLAGGAGYTAPPAVTISTATSYGAPPMPANYTKAAILLCREHIAMDDALNASPTNVMAGATILVRTSDQEIRYQPIAAKSVAPLGYGTPLALAAMRLLGSKRQTRIA